MAIRTQVIDSVRRVITKVVDEERRVSCSCCVTAECCMYPARAVEDESIAFEDLPDVVIYSNRGMDGNVTFNKLEAPVELTIGFMAYYLAQGSPAIGSGDEDVIYLGEDQNWINWVSAGLNAVGLCLIEGFNVASGVIDNFEDTYSYDLVFNGSTLESGTITRIGLCIWSNTNLVNQTEGGAIFTGVAYSDATNGFGDQGAVLQWATYDGNDFKATKTPPHNSPEGTYVAVGGLYDGAVATVFQ